MNKLIGGFLVGMALAATDFTGVTGRTKLDAQRNATKPAVIITVENGQFKFLQTVEP